MTFLETDEIMNYDGVEVKVFKLPKDVLENIYYNNFSKTIKAVRAVNKRLVSKYAEKLLEIVKDEENAIENIKKIMSICNI